MKKLVVAWLFTLAAAAFVVAALRTRGHSVALTTRYNPTRVLGSRFPKALETGGTLQHIAEKPRRIASLTVTADEILTALVEPSRIAAVTHFADDPTVETSTARAPSGATRVRGADPEQVIALEPDVVFVAHYTLESGVRILNAAAIPVVRLKETRSFLDVADNVRLAAAAVGEEARGEAVLSTLAERLSQVKRRTTGLSPVRVLYYSAVGYTSGRGTLVDEKIRLAGGRNVAAEAGLVGFKNVGLDVLVGMDPDVIIVPRWTTDAESPVRDVANNPAWRDVAAVRTGHVFAMTAAALTSESPDGVIGVEEPARRLHPEAFSS